MNANQFNNMGFVFRPVVFPIATFDPLFHNPCDFFFDRPYDSLFAPTVNAFEQPIFMPTFTPTFTPTYTPIFSSTLTDMGSGGFVRKDDTYVCELEIAKDLIDYVKVKEQNRTVSVSAEKVDNKEQNIDGFVTKSSSSQYFNKILQLPDDAVENTVTAKYMSGKLQIIADVNEWTP